MATFGSLAPDLEDPAIAEYVAREQAAAPVSYYRRLRDALLSAAGPASAVLPVVGPTIAGAGAIGAELLRGRELENIPGKKESSAVLPLMSDAKGNMWLSPSAGVIGSAIRGGMLPGDVLAGKTELPMYNDPQYFGAPTDPNKYTAGMSQLADFVGLVAGGGMPAAEKGAVGIFGGQLAKGADKAKLVQAQRMAQEGLPRETIWGETGWFQGADNKWRFEIPDNRSVVTGELTPKTQNEPVGELFRHPELYRNYPDAAEVDMALTRVAPKDRGGRYYPDAARAPDELAGMEVRASTLPEARSITLHESQHHIQALEDFARGGNKQLPVVMKEAEKLVEKQLPWAENVYNRFLPERQSFIKQRMDEGATFAQAQADYKARRPDADRVFNDARALIEYAEGSRDVAAVQKFRREAYRNLAGEVEARNVQTRMDMTPEERLARPPWTTEDVPRAQQIVIDDMGNPIQLADYGDPLSHRKDAEEIAAETRGADIYKRLGLPATSPAEAYPKSSAALRERGVPGLQYRDAASRPDIVETDRGWVVDMHDRKYGPYKTVERATQEADKRATYNYVIFDDKLVKILKKYGILIPGAAAAAEFTGGFGSLAPQEM